MLIVALRSGFAGGIYGEVVKSELVAKVAAILSPVESSIVESVLQEDALLGEEVHLMPNLEDSPGESRISKPRNKVCFCNRLESILIDKSRRDECVSFGRLHVRKYISNTSNIPYRRWQFQKSCTKTGRSNLDLG